MVDLPESEPFYTLGPDGFHEHTFEDIIVKAGPWLLKVFDLRDRVSSPGFELRFPVKEPRFVHQASCTNEFLAVETRREGVVTVTGPFGEKQKATSYFFVYHCVGCDTEQSIYDILKSTEQGGEK
jgi:hypothetical protein